MGGFVNPAHRRPPQPGRIAALTEPAWVRQPEAGQIADRHPATGGRMDTDAKVADIDRRLITMSARTDREPIERWTCLDRLLDRRLDARA